MLILSRKPFGAKALFKSNLSDPDKSVRDRMVLFASIHVVDWASVKHLVSMIDATGGCAQDMRAMCFHSARDADFNRIGAATARLDAYGAPMCQAPAWRHFTSASDKASRLGIAGRRRRMGVRRAIRRTSTPAMKSER